MSLAEWEWEASSHVRTFNQAVISVPVCKVPIFPHCVPSLNLNDTKYILLWFILRVQVLFQNRSWSTFSGDGAAAFSLKATLLAQSLMRWKNPKGQIMFKWHFDDISLARLTFGEFHFFLMHYILSMQTHFSFVSPPNMTSHQSLDRTPWITATEITDASIQPQSRER